MSDEPRCEVCGTEPADFHPRICQICWSDKSNHVYHAIEAARIKAEADWDAAHPARFGKTKGDKP